MLVGVAARIWIKEKLCLAHVSTSYCLGKFVLIMNIEKQKQRKRIKEIILNNFMSG